MIIRESKEQNQVNNLGENDRFNNK